MGSSIEFSAAPSREFLAVFRTHADADGTMSFARFMELALYHAEVGYYRRSRARIGYQPGTDFFTATTSGAVFGELVSCAAAKLLRDAGRDPRRHAFIELGAEPDSRGVLDGVDHPFAEVRIVRVADAPQLAGEAIVFSNELFDAQPFLRTVYRGGQWQEIRVRLDGERLVECEAKFDGTASNSATEDYHFDRPLQAAQLAAALAEQPWQGLFVAVDYGKTLRELELETPAGTARAYYRHQQSNDLLARPGEQDLTCHICWDWLADALRQRGFREPELSFQETFFIRHAGEFIAAATAADAAGLTRRKLSLLQLLHPAQLGQKFQVLHALR